MDPEFQAFPFDDVEVEMKSDQSRPEDIWFRYLTIVFCGVLLFRLIHEFGGLGKLYSFLFFLVTIATPSGRWRRSERIRISKELITLREQLKAINMISNFAAYSKMERKVKTLERQQRELAPESLGEKIAYRFFIRIFSIILEGFMFSWLLAHSPPQLITADALKLAKLQGSSALLILYYIFYYIPPKLLIISWIALCRLTMGSFVHRIRYLLCARVEKRDHGVTNGINVEALN